MGGEGGFHGKLDRPAVEDRQHPRHPLANHAGLGIGGRAEAGAASAEDLGFGQELGVDLQADDRFVIHCAALLGFFLMGNQ